MAKKRVKNKLTQVLQEQAELIRPDELVMKKLKKNTKIFVNSLNQELLKHKIDAEAFIGGSYAKGTLTKSDVHDVDVFVRFDWKYQNLSDPLSNVLKNLSKKHGFGIEKVHGSRDYFKVFKKDWRGYFEVVPVTKIKKVHEERNVTDLSYFHVPYIKKRIQGLEDDVRLAKLFCIASRVYGAETYVRGFSGYALEILVIYYGSFAKMLRELVKVKKGERLVVDVEKKYKRKDNVFMEMNEAKLNSPVILVDPTYKERNALAALSKETFEKFQKAAADFLRNPELGFFIQKEIDLDELKKKSKKRKADFVHLRISTKKQKGDIAGTKLKKFADNFAEEIEKYFMILDSEFEYSGLQDADFYLVLRSRKELIRIGPPLHLKKHVSRFKKEHMDIYEKNKHVHAKIKLKFDGKTYLDIWKKTNKRKMKEMSISGMKII